LWLKNRKQDRARIPGLGAAYLFLAYVLVTAIAVLAVVTVAPARTETKHGRLIPITNQSSGADLERHFGKKPFKIFPASTLGLPDGTCYAYSNQVSWLSINCYGAMPPVKP
jgi:hypothetical protein